VNGLSTIRALTSTDGRRSADAASDIVRAALEVHRVLGPGLEPTIYQRALELELEERRLRFWSDVYVDLTYRGRRLGRSRVPIVTGGVLVGIRVTAELTDGEAALLSAQAKAMHCGGILFNFGAERLEIRRVRPPRSSNG
jgi:GxxExxY protein